MSIKERLKADMIAAMKGKEKEKLEAIRFIQAAIKKQEVDTRKDLDDAAVTAILVNQVKQRKDSIDQFRKGNREDLAAKEESELKILQAYMPEQMTNEEVQGLVDAAIAELNASGMKDMGAVMKVVGAKTAGKAEGGIVSAIVKQRLTK